MKGVAKGVMGTTAVVEDLEPKIYEWEYQGQGFGTGGRDIMYGIASNGSRLVTVMAGGKVAYSDDSVNWTFVPSFTTQPLYAITCSPSGRFLAASRSLIGFYSDDGINWTAINDFNDGNPSNAIILNIACSPSGRFVIGDTSGYASYSDDCINWVTLPRSLNSGLVGSSGIYALECNAHTGRFYAGVYNYASYSDDGINWFPLPVGLGLVNSSTRYIYSFAFRKDGRIVAGQASGYGGYSDDAGATWHEIERGFGTGTTTIPRALMCDNRGQFIYGNDFGFSSYSNDGINWTLIGQGFGTGRNSAIRGMIQDPRGDIMAVGSNGDSHRGT